MTQPPMYKGPRSDLWKTPQWIRDVLDEQYNIEIDLAACAESTLADKYFSASFSLFDVTLSDVFNEQCWINPPFSQGPAFLTLASFHCKKLIGIYKANFETKIWQDVLFPKVDWIFVPNKRVRYKAPLGVQTSSPQFCSVIFGWGVPEFQSDYGTILKVKK